MNTPRHDRPHYVVSLVVDNTVSLRRLSKALESQQLRMEATSQKGTLRVFDARQLSLDYGAHTGEAGELAEVHHDGG